MRKVKVQVGWCERNFGASVTFDDFPGTVLATHKDLDGLKETVREAVKSHIEACLADGDDVPQYLATGDYELEWNLDTSALIRSVEPFTSIAALSRASGINQRQLSHYANGLKQPRPQQRERIVAGLHRIGEHFMAIV